MSKEAAVVAELDAHRRWWTLVVSCLGVLMIAINATIVNVALPSIMVDLRFSESSLVWVVNAYLCSFGGFLLLGGRLGDLFGHRRTFSLGILLFTLASLGCGLADTPELLVSARSVQGFAAAVVSAVALAQIMNLYIDLTGRAKAVGIFAFVGASGGSIGVLLAGILISALSWRWIFLSNVLLGTVVYIMCITQVPCTKSTSTLGHLDIAGALTITTAIMLAIYAIVNGSQQGSSISHTPVLLASAGVLLVIFVGIESRVQAPLVPLGLFRIHNLAVANIVGPLLAVAVLSWNFVSPLYLQRVLHFNASQVALAFLPATFTTAVISLVVAPMLVTRFGFRRPLAIGMLITGVGLAYLARTPESANTVLDVLPAMVLVGLGHGMAYNPLLLSALSGVAPLDSGVASGVFNTSFMIGGTLGLSILASSAAARTDDLLASGVGLPFALNAGYQVAFFTGAVVAAMAALLSSVLLRPGPKSLPSSDVVRP